MFFSHVVLQSAEAGAIQDEDTVLALRYCVLSLNK